jgi:adenylate kinase
MSKIVKFNLILLGPAGSGKGTQAKLLAEKFNLQIIETGELVRAQAKKKTRLGKLFAWMHRVGMHFSDQTIFDLMESALKRINKKKGILFDGYPRTAGQAWDLERLIKKYASHRPTFALWLKVGEKEAMRRLLTRSVCSKCGQIFTSRKIKKCPKCGAKVIVRDYDTDYKSIKERLDWFRDHVLPAIEFYRQRKILITINGEQSVEKVFSDIVSQLKKKIKGLRKKQ